MNEDIKSPSIDKPITDSKLIMLLKDVIRPVLSLIASTRVPYKDKLIPCRENAFLFRKFKIGS